MSTIIKIYKISYLLEMSFTYSHNEIFMYPGISIPYVDFQPSRDISGYRIYMSPEDRLLHLTDPSGNDTIFISQGATGAQGPRGFQGLPGDMGPPTGLNSVNQLEILPSGTTNIDLVLEQKGKYHILVDSTSVSFTTNGFSEADANWFCILKNVNGSSVTLNLNTPVVMTNQVVWLVWDGTQLVGY